MRPTPQIDKPEAGYYQRKLVKGGVWVPVRLWQEEVTRDLETLERETVWKVEIDGKPWSGDIYDLWTWICGHPITEAEYRYLLARGGWAKRNDPDSPMANPADPVDWLKVKPPRYTK